MRLIDAEAKRFANPRARPEGQDPGDLALRYRRVRSATTDLAAPLTPEDQVVQSMPDTSPVKWHLAHSTWFWETFLLAPNGAPSFDPSYAFLFNSYYEALGARHPRPHRGLLTRPDLESVRRYRAFVDEHMLSFLDRGVGDRATRDLVALGLAHEEQHQELLLTDVLHLFAQNPLRPAYRRPSSAPQGKAVASQDAASFVDFEGGLIDIGAPASWDGGDFAFDNEGPRHRVYLQPFRLSDRLVTNAEWIGFVEDGGYRRSELWLSDGWASVVALGWAAPLYWEMTDGVWTGFGLEGPGPLDPAAPVTHISYYEADAFARWSGRRLPTEMEWEHAASQAAIAGGKCNGNFRESGALRPLPADTRSSSCAAKPLRQMFGDVWEWTSSPYSPYPGFRPAAGAVGEYNGKFMINQMVLRGGSCATPEDHIRPTYRNFFQPHQRWQFSGLRLADDLG